MDPALGLPHRRKMQILFAIMLGLFLSALDQTIVGVALPTIVGELQGNNELYTWVITSYLLAATITGVFYGKLSDIFGRRLMLLFGITVFLAGSALSGLSWSMESLILFRGIQGIGAGAIFPISLAVIGDLFSPRERGRYQGLFGAVFGIAAILGSEDLLCTNQPRSVRRCRRPRSDRGYRGLDRPGMSAGVAPIRCLRPA